MNTQYKELHKELHVALMQHISKHGADAFNSPVWLVRERGENDWGRAVYEWAFEFSGGEGDHIGLSQEEITARMREWCQEEGNDWDSLSQDERDSATVAMYKELYVDELMDRITAEGHD